MTKQEKAVLATSLVDKGDVSQIPAFGARCKCEEKEAFSRHTNKISCTVTLCRSVGMKATRW